jgi:hypothetical protein
MALDWGALSALRIHQSQSQVAQRAKFGLTENTVASEFSRQNMAFGVLPRPRERPREHCGLTSPMSRAAQQTPRL